MIFFVYTLIAIATLGLVTGLSHLYQVRKTQRMLDSGEIRLEDIPADVNPYDMECCGQHEVCEKDSLLAAISKQIEYYDDEELDRFRGRDSHEYSAEETDEFRDVLYTMRSDEVAGWVRSLQLRQVNLPDDMKDEVIMIVGERRMESAKSHPFATSN